MAVPFLPAAPRRRIVGALGLMLAALAPGLAHAATGRANGSDTVWILVSSALVLMMCMPGLGLFYGGLVRAMNMLSVLVQIGAIAAAASVLWIVCGYALAFGPVGNGWIGGMHGVMFSGLAPLRAGLPFRKMPLRCSSCALPRSPRR